MNRIGVVGAASFYGPHYATLAGNRPDATVAGFVVDPDVTDDALVALDRPTRSELRDRFDCPLYDTVGDLLANESLDGVVVASETTRRADDAVTAIESGQPILTAKPAAASSDGAARIARAASKQGVPAMTTSPARFDRSIREAHQRVEAGDLGEPIAIDATIRHDRVPAAGIDVNAEHAPEQAGAVFAMGYYTTDLVEWLGGAPVTRISGELTNANTPHSAHPDTGVATVRLANDVRGTMRLQYATDCRERLGNWEVEVVGSEGIVRTAHVGYEGIHWTAGEPGDRRARVFGRVPSPILEEQFAAFLESVETGERPAIAPTPSAVVSALRDCEAWQRAASKDESVSVPVSSAESPDVGERQSTSR